MRAQLLRAIAACVMAGASFWASAQDSCSPVSSDTDDPASWSSSELDSALKKATDRWLKNDFDADELTSFLTPRSNSVTEYFERRALEARWGLRYAERMDGTGGRRSNGKTSKPIAQPVDTANRDAEGTMTNPKSCSGVVLATGEKVTTEPDFASRGMNGLSLTRTFRSNGASGYFFGPNWATDYDPVKYTVSTAPCLPVDSGCYPPDVTVTFPTGASYKYTLNMTTQDGEYNVKNSAAMGALYYSIAGRRVGLLEMEKRSYSFDSSKRVTQVTGPDGALVKYTYDTNAKPATISNAAGQLFKLTWIAGKVTQVIDPAGQTWTYEYNANGQLAKVTSPGNPADVREYHYEHAADIKLLTGVTINGTRYSTYKYDTSKRVTESSLSGSEHKDGFVYATNQTTITNALGLATVFKFTTAYGGKLLTSASNSAQSTCGSTAATVAYDMNGYVDYVLDWRGNKTDYDFDATGRLTKVTSAAGTAQAKQIQYSWSATTGKVDEVRHYGNSGTAYLKVGYTYAGDRLASETETDLKFGGGARSITYGYTNHPSGAIATKTTTHSVAGGGTATTTETYDTAGNLFSLKNPLGQTVTWSGHDGLGRPGQIVDANNVSTSLGYDPKGNHTSTTHNLPSGARVTSYGYNNNRQLTDATSPTGAIARLRYDAAMQVERTGNAEQEYVLRRFDLATKTVTMRSTRERPSLNGSTPAAVTDGEFVRSTVLDTFGRASVETGNGGQSLTTTYDANGNVKTRTDAANRQTLYDYDAQNRLIRTTAPDGGITEMGYDNEGRLKFIKDPRGLQTDYTYNGFGERLTQKSPDTGTTTYTYDVAGNLATELRAGSQLFSYEHDKLGRLTSRTVNGISELFVHDEGSHGVGRLTSVHDGTGDTTYAYNAAGQLVERKRSIDDALAARDVC